MVVVLALEENTRIKIRSITAGTVRVVGIKQVMVNLGVLYVRQVSTKAKIHK